MNSVLEKDLKNIEIEKSKKGFRKYRNSGIKYEIL